MQLPSFRSVLASLGSASLAITFVTIAACSSRPIIPDAKDVKLKREDPPRDCKEIGKVQGSVTSNKGTIEQAIEDMKLDAARKGANYVRMESTSAYGSSASGTAFSCP